MYVPELYEPADLAAMHAVIRDHPFGLLVLPTDGRQAGVHLPFVLDLDADAGPRGRLRAHLSGANPLAGALEAGAEAMVVFTGPQSYICPDDYASEPHFPTWNYVAVHAYGTPRVLSEQEAFQQLTDLIADQEGRLAPKPPWTLDRAPEGLTDQYRRMITAFELEIDRIEGIFKLGQNKQPEDIAAQAAAFRGRGTDSADTFAGWLESHRTDAGGSHEHH
ncbi:FMN-binding negative transcriptional regulator [Streptacidiphilus sp. P02-A3a]|uniref:FMN-binding negative transcriptional regulator n=1 Tax=Streptacidiphilus sp. P02-A3a TaxID=2704468 RepID=UPI0015FC76B9|nr:FMN-binding negative transcriptional regulator [Streptacidiphilus sp. P02-A3a]QMU71299.1 FMN-binding negative transcriptional regulator [Streptacidiphilus sp. P02-A3a]